MNVTVLIPVPANLLTALVAYHVDSICRPASDALSATGLDYLRTRVARLVNAGRLDVARSLVADEVAVGCLSREITRHQSGDCDVCPDGWRYCETLARMEAREARLFDLIQRAGGAI